MTERVTNLWSWFDDEIAGRLLFTLLHFLWQAAIIAGMAWLLAHILKRAEPKVRYLMYCTAMASLPACLVTTFFFCETPVTARADVLGSEMPLNSQLESSLTASIADGYPGQPAITAIENQSLPQNQSFALRFPNAARCLISLYLLGVLCFLVRLMAGVWGGSRLRSRSTVIRDSRLCQQIADQATQMRLRSAPVVAYCQGVTVPTPYLLEKLKAEKKVSVIFHN